MRLETLPKLRCPKKKSNQKCNSLLTTKSTEVEVHSGFLDCPKCKARFPILAGVAILVHDVRDYILSHAKGIALLVPDSEVPREFQKEFRIAKEPNPNEIETDLESERVVSLYFMNHYLPAAAVQSQDPAIQGLIEKYWDRGLFQKIYDWIKPGDILELGCSVGGLAKKINSAYLGIDHSFLSVALGRHLLLGTPYPPKIKIPVDLIDGPTSKEMKIETQKKKHTDLVVGDFENPPVAEKNFDTVIALNTIDMLDRPSRQPEIQKELLKPGGIAIQSSPYIWPEGPARKMKSYGKDSATAAQNLYEKTGFAIERSFDRIPWLFLKHDRQLELYSVHAFEAKKI